MTEPVAGAQLAEPEVLQDLLLYRLSRLQAIAGGIVVRYCAGRFGITRREWHIVGLLAALGPMSSSDLASRAWLDRPRTSKAVTALVAKNLVNRASRAGDARFTRLSLTPEGVKLYAQVFPVVSRINQDILAVLQPQELGVLDSILGRLQLRAEGMVAQGGLPLADRRQGGTARRRRAA